jgi:hypothetical protein
VKLRFRRDLGRLDRRLFPHGLHLESSTYSIDSIVLHNAAKVMRRRRCWCSKRIIVE